MIRACHVALVVKKLPANADVGSIPGLGRSPAGGQEPTPVFLPGESHGKRSLVGYGPRSHKESDTTEATEIAHMETLFTVHRWVFSLCPYLVERSR